MLTFLLRHRSGTVLRISEAESAVLEEDSGPRPPAAAALETKWHVQGTLLEVRRDKLIVAFDELDVWPLGEDEAYQYVPPSVPLDESAPGSAD